MWGSLSVTGLAYLFHLLSFVLPFSNAWPHALVHFPHAVFDLFNKMSLGMALGIFFVGLLNLVPRELIVCALGRHQGLKGILRATALGVLLDLCSHGILMVGMKLFERGASLGQTMAFLIASPWNSISLTFILIALIGLPWTLVFILASAVIAVISGLIFDGLVSRNKLPARQREVELPEDYQFFREAKIHFSGLQFNYKTWIGILINGVKESRPILKWLFFGLVVAAFLQAFVSTDVLKTYFGPTILGLLSTLVVTTIIEVCSEGSTPIAADIFNRAEAPGNAFTFLMAGVATDYTEIMAIKETMRSWKVALFLPLITVPQILLLSYILNLSFT